MRYLMYALSIVPVAVFSTALSGCTTVAADVASSVAANVAANVASTTNAKDKQQNSPQQEDFTSANVYSHSFPGPDRAACEAARRALLSQGYVINEASASQVKARKNFQPDNETHTQIEFNVVCAPDTNGGNGGNGAMVFANAVRDRYSLRKSSDSASLGVSVLGSVSVPVRSTNDSLVKVGSETIPSGQFYQQFFELVERYLDPGSLNDKTGSTSNQDATIGEAAESHEAAPMTVAGKS